ncbi:hypothetical protein BpHYR1_025069 [Brachionus plicatilis]|uniref:Uncharacterized protein n=1 Tax=Brachionus plicatilis TaxID=10195 RepID=A0A3M7SEB4_BRAPC|nr:hypothetical protein BpHYR1_025069 [Brachionus plicatilis]
MKSFEILINYTSCRKTTHILLKENEGHGAPNDTVLIRISKCSALNHILNILDLHYNLSTYNLSTFI